MSLTTERKKVVKNKSGVALLSVLKFLTRVVHAKGMHKKIENKHTHQTRCEKKKSNGRLRV